MNVIFAPDQKRLSMNTETREESDMLLGMLRDNGVTVRVTSVNTWPESAGSDASDPKHLENKARQ